MIIMLVLGSALGLLPSVQSLSLSISPAQTAAWRKQIFQQLSERAKRELENFRHYEQAIEQVSESRPISFLLTDHDLTTVNIGHQ